MIVVVDFGSQTAHLIARRIKELHVATRFVTPDEAIPLVTSEKPQGIILSGGPASVYSKSAPTIDPMIFSFGIPTLAICYGFQLAVRLLGGKVVSGKKEYGPAELRIKNQESKITKKLAKKSTVWMSHGDEVVALPDGFTTLGSTEHVPFAFAQAKKINLIGVLFHPEVEHTEEGARLLQNFITHCNVKQTKHTITIEPLIRNIRERVGEDGFVIGAVSGGVDSTVAGALTAKAIGKRFIPIYVANGLMRQGTEDQVRQIFSHIGVKPDIVHAEKEMLQRLKGKTDPEEKRKIIGNFYIELFEKEMQKLIKQKKQVKFLMQGTIYSDVIESKGSKHADKIKSHHNVGGLPKNMKLSLIEPLRTFYKDEVRLIGQKLGLPEEFVWQQVFPGPGYAVRIRGEVTKERLSQIKQADAIVIEELKRSGDFNRVYMSFPIMTGALSTAVKGDGRFFGEVIALRIIESKDVMTATWSRLSYDVLQKIASRIVNEAPNISRVVYDITTKPPATMEWE